MADRGDGLAGGEEVADERHDLVRRPQRVGTDAPARNDQAIELGGRHVADRLVDRERLAGIEIGVERLRVARLEADDRHVPAGLLDRRLWLRELGFLGAAGCDHNRDFLALERHVSPFDSLNWCGGVRPGYR